MNQTSDDLLRNSVDDDYRVESSREPTRWEANHGNILLLFVGAIMIVGTGILAYQQSRFVPPRFPDGKAIEAPSLALIGEAERREDLIIIRINGAKSDEGFIRIAIFDSVAGFADPNGAFLAESVEINDGTAGIGVPPDRLPERFAVAAYHDRNGDGQLSLNQFGIPVEAYGFSNNVRSFVGPPAFESAVMKRPEAGTQIVIDIR